MGVVLENRYTVEGTRSQLNPCTVLTILAGLLIAGGTTIAALARDSHPNKPFASWGFMFLAAGVLAIGLAYARTVATEGAHRMAGMHQLAERLDRKSWLLDAFRPTQEAVDRRLGVLAHVLNVACVRQAEFYTRNSLYIGDRAEAAGCSILIDSALTREEEALKAVVRGCKTHFWTMHGAIQQQGYAMQPQWKTYLTLGGVGPDDPDVLTIAEQLQAANVTRKEQGIRADM